jgi:uncharacterized protein (UPF0128 family)
MIGLAGRVARTREIENTYRTLPENLKEERKHSEVLRIDGRIILKWILEKYSGKVWTGISWIRIGTSDGCCEHGNEP